MPGNPAVQKCPSCSKLLEQPVRFCPDCGTALTDTAAVGPRTPVNSRRQLPLPTMIGNRYKIIEARGGGGMAQVYKGIDLTLDREVAVKVINPDLRSEPEFDARFQREAKIAAGLQDPHIVVVHDFGLDAEHGPYLVMEYLQGQTLRERIATQGKLPLKAGLQLSGQLLLALVHAHTKGIVHRDIKPDNIFLLHQGGVRMHIRVLDFGIARIYRSDDPGRVETLTHHGAVLGTPRYMSPEQLAGQTVDARSDLYSAALVIHEAITGRLPYTTDAKLSELCPEASSQLQDLLDHCLKKDMNDRPGSALEVYLRLQELGKASGILLLPPGAMEKLAASRQTQQDTIAYTPKLTDPAHPRSRWWIVLVVLALVLAISVSVGALLLSSWLAQG